MSEKDILFTLKQFAWVFVTALCWLYAARGHSSWPRFDLWLWGILFSLNVVTFTASMFLLVFEAER